MLLHSWLERRHSTLVLVLLEHTAGVRDTEECYTLASTIRHFLKITIDRLARIRVKGVTSAKARTLEEEHITNCAKAVVDFFILIANVTTCTNIHPDSHGGTRQSSFVTAMLVELLELYVIETANGEG
jgi:hydrogenase-4 membrane subunit HyfE